MDLLRLELLSVATTVIVLDPGFKARDVDQLFVPVARFPLTLTSFTPLESEAVPLTVMGDVLNTWPFVGWSMLREGGMVSEGGDGLLTVISNACL